jgi:hypothetical protein
MNAAAFDAARLVSRECVTLLGRSLGARTVLFARMATAEPECRTAVLDETAVDLSDGTGVSWKTLPAAVLWPLYERWRTACPPHVLDALLLAVSPTSFSAEFATGHLAAGMYLQSFAKLLDWLTQNTDGLEKFDERWRLFMDSYELVDPNPFYAAHDREWAAARQLRWAGAVGEDSERLARNGMPSDNNQPAGATSQNTSQLSWEAQALASLIDHPTWTQTQIANSVGRSRSTLQRSKRFKSAWRVRGGIAREQRQQLDEGRES